MSKRRAARSEVKCSQGHAGWRRARPEEWPGSDTGVLDVVADGLSGGVVEADRTPVIALLVQPDGGLPFSVLVKIRNLQPATGRQPCSRIQVKL